MSEFGKKRPLKPSNSFRFNNSNKSRENSIELLSNRSNTHIFPNNTPEMRSLSPNICYPNHQNNRLSPPESNWVVPKTPFKVAYLRDQLRSAMVTLDTNFILTLCRGESISLTELTDSFRDIMWLKSQPNFKGF